MPGPDAGRALAEVATIEPALFGSVQICDGPLTIDPQSLADEAGTERMLPGTGAFPVKEFLRMVPPGVPIGMEVPLRSLREGGVSALERTRRVLEATRELQRLMAGEATGG